MVASDEGRRTNGLLLAGIVLAIIALVALVAGFLITLCLMLHTFNGPEAAMVENAKQGVAFSWNANFIAMMVAVPSGLLAVGLIVVGIVRGRRKAF